MSADGSLTVLPKQVYIGVLAGVPGRDVLLAITNEGGECVRLQVDGRPPANFPQVKRVLLLLTREQVDELLLHLPAREGA